MLSNLPAIMNNTKVMCYKNCLISALIVVYQFSYSQVDTFDFYTIDTTVFLAIKQNNNIFIDLRENIPDGYYILYDDFKTNKTISQIHSFPIFEGSILNNRRNGLFKYTSYCLSEKCYEKCYEHLINYREGLKDGLETEQHICYNTPQKFCIPITVGNYLLGLKNGIFLNFFNGELIRAVEYKDDTLKEIYINTRNADYLLGNP